MQSRSPFSAFLKSLSSKTRKLSFFFLIWECSNRLESRFVCFASVSLQSLLCSCIKNKWPSCCFVDMATYFGAQLLFFSKSLFKNDQESVSVVSNIHVSWKDSSRYLEVWDGFFLYNCCLFGLWYSLLYNSLKLCFGYIPFPEAFSITEGVWSSRFTSLSLNWLLYNLGEESTLIAQRFVVSVRPLALSQFHVAFRWICVFSNCAFKTVLKIALKLMSYIFWRKTHFFVSRAILPRFHLSVHLSLFSFWILNMSVILYYVGFSF